jgi:hypothetical protein
MQKRVALHREDIYADFIVSGWLQRESGIKFAIFRQRNGNVMRVCIHRGSQQIGGSCVEVEKDMASGTMPCHPDFGFILKIGGVAS